VLGGALPAEDRAPDVVARVLGPGVGVDGGVALRVEVAVAVAVVVVPACLEVAEVDETGEGDGVPVTVVGSLIGGVSGEVFPPRMESPVPPDSGPPLTVSSSVTVARLPAKTTTAAAAAASTTISGRRDRRGAGAAGRLATGITIVGSS
jgi:hypothetical protein